MKALPAIDLREGSCVQLVGGSYDREAVRLPDALEVARGFATSGLRRLHVVDLDAATGRGSNASLVAALAALPGMKIQAGGGVRDDDAVARLLDLGVDRVVVGTRAVEDAAWLEAVAARFPNRLVVAADVRGRAVVTRGWSAETALDVADLLRRLEPLPIAAVLVTAVHVEGSLGGPDLDVVRLAVSSSSKPVIASGGIASLDDLRRLAETGAAEAVVGMALYTGRIDPSALAQEFA